LRICPDANVLVALLVTEVHSDTVTAFWESLSDADEIIGAQLLLPECTSTFREKVSRGELSQAEAIGLVERMSRLPIRISLEARQFTRALELAGRIRSVKAYDMQYVAAAEAEQCELVTLDGGPYQTAVEIGLPVRLLR
jgi:predicted nucleic acid-binding protein